MATYDTIKNKADDVANRISSATTTDLAVATDRLKTEANVQFDRLSDTIRNKPIQSAAIAAGLGFLVAIIARR